ncbi:hypothetical protein ACLESD_21560 [Pyxidicoccus sp. 3LFB2]
MKTKLIAASVFLFGLGLGGGAARASSMAAESGPSGITEEMARCVSDCKANGGAHQLCWNCCVKNMCDY